MTNQSNERTFNDCVEIVVPILQAMMFYMVRQDKNYQLNIVFGLAEQLVAYLEEAKDKS